MNNREKNCEWFFAQCVDGAHERGLNNAMSEHFKSQSKYETLVRESIQNSLDAVLDKNKPVKVKFSFYPLKLPYQSMPHFMEIKQYINGCIDYWSSNSEIERQYRPMITYLEHCYDELSFLRVSDYNTKGMDYQKDDNNCTFFAFLRAEGTSVKSMTDSGGSFGFGKMAYFVLSKIRTIIVSTMNADGNLTFEGSSMLCTNKVNGTKYVDVGYYDAAHGTPITTTEDIPEDFRRTEPGTDINIMGIDFSKEKMHNYKAEIIAAVLKHFWMAIYEQKLEVYMGGTQINKENLDNLMLRYYPETTDLNTHYENPRAYYEAVSGIEKNNKNCKLYQEEIDPLGKCRFYMMRNRGSRDRYLTMRSPLMVVQAFNSISSKGYSAVFVCDGEGGNELLKMTEPPAHDKWDRNRVSDKYDYREKKARKALTEIRNFSIRCVTDFFQSAEQDTTEILGLDQLLYNPINDSTPADFGNLVNNDNGESSEDLTDVENGSPVTNLEIPPKRYFDDSNLGKITVKDSGYTNYGGNLLGGNSDKKLHSKAPNPKPRHGTTNVHNKQHEDNGKEINNFERPVEVTYRCFAIKEDSKTIHKLVFYSPIETENGILRLKSATADPNKLEAIPIIWSDHGESKENRIENLKVVKGKNTIKFRFEDNISHAVNLEAYYEEK